MLAVKVMTYVVDNPERNTERTESSIQPIQIPAELLWTKERRAKNIHHRNKNRDGLNKIHNGHCEINQSVANHYRRLSGR